MGCGGRLNNDHPLLRTGESVSMMRVWTDTRAGGAVMPTPDRTPEPHPIVDGLRGSPEQRPSLAQDRGVGLNDESLDRYPRVRGDNADPRSDPRAASDS